MSDTQPEQPDSNIDLRIPKPPHNASLVGWYGFENAGDDAFFAILCKWMIEEFGAQRISVSGCDSRLPKTAKQLPAQIQGNETERVLGRIERFFHEPKNLFGHDIVIFGGGSIFSRRRFWWLAVQAGTLRLLRRIGLCQTKVAAVGVSIGPFRRLGDRFWCKWALRLFDAVMVRDVGSYETGQEFGIKNLISSMDLALVLPKFYEIAERRNRNTKDDRPVVGFSVVDRDTEFGSPEVDEAKRQRLVDSLLEVAKKYPKVRFRGFIFCKHRHAGDYVATEKILDPLRADGHEAEIVEYDNDPVSLCNQIAKTDVMVCNRMHSFVFACITRTPAVMVSYAPKMIEFARTLDVPSDLIFAHDKFDSPQLQTKLIQLIESQELPCQESVLANCSDQILSDLSSVGSLLRASS